MNDKYVSQYLDERKLVWTSATYKAALSRFKHFSMDAEAVYRKMLEQGYKPYYIKVSFVMFSGYMEWYKAHGGATHKNVYKEFLERNKQLFRNAYEDKYTTLSVRDFLSEYSMASPDMQTVLVLLGIAGCRLSEIYTFDGKTVMGKGGKRRAIFIPQGFQVQEKVTLNPHAIRRALKHTPHAYRKLSADTWFKKGLDIKTVQVLLGHSSLQATQRYLRPMQQDELQNSIDNIWRNAL